jgi:hypothetical protein
LSINDYFKDSFLRDRVTGKFFSETIPFFLANDRILKPGGQIFLPNTPYIREQVEKNLDSIRPLSQDIRLLKDPKMNPLYSATDLMEFELEKAPGNVTNKTQLPILLQYSNAPFLLIIKRGAESGELIFDITKDFYLESASEPFPLTPTNKRKKRQQDTPMPKTKAKRVKSNGHFKSPSSPVIDLTDDERSPRSFVGRVSFSP